MDGKSGLIRRSLILSLAGLLTLVGRARPVAACCPVHERNERVTIADQEILILWDPERSLERFVRRASFETAVGRDFGFLVPTPSKPALAEIPNAVFDRLRKATSPKVVNGYRANFTPLVLYPFLMLMLSKGERVEPVRVLDRQTIAGYDAVVLEADDAAALGHWLQANGYHARPEIENWAKPYVAAHWKVTAFKYAGEGATAGTRARDSSAVATTGAISLSFSTDRPLFPYRVPTDQIARAGDQNVLRVFFVGPDRVEGALGAAAAPWAGVTRYANRVDGLRSILADVSPADALADAGWLMMFEDRTWPRGSEDLFFSRKTDGAPIVPVVDRATVIPLPLDLVVVLAGSWLLRWRRRAAAAHPPR